MEYAMALGGPVTILPGPGSLTEYGVFGVQCRPHHLPMGNDVDHDPDANY